MPKYFFAPEDKQGNEIFLQGETAHHLLHVLRHKIGDKIILCDGANTDYTTSITQISKKPTITCLIEETRTCQTEPAVQITLFQGLPKGDKLELIIQKCVELGVTEVIPVLTSRSITKIKDAKKTERYQRIAESAAGQSMRGIIPTVHPTITFAEAVKQINGLTVVAYENEKTQTLKQTITPSPNINIWIGPEGGFSQEEIDTLIKQGAAPVTLGARILRTETAAIATVAQVILLTNH